ncbi:hypothetical protein HUO13_35410 [Saccharopolyspora erythraea]|uniref:hypothetical protein n=1 Tax=Saccharopolyspora erythraea TaxID=1836 RepID=UPI001BA62B81|nr:hypothetical protein [Saccharopolyspora erythraea]QUH05367.1 hypothetical protein HUO13_35410 [Saccharopolyspora erythraea]
MTREVTVFRERPGTGLCESLIAQARWWVQGRSVYLEVELPPHTYRSSGTSLFYAMLDLRQSRLEPEGLLLLTEGCRCDVWALSTPEQDFPGTRGIVLGTETTVDLLATVGERYVPRVGRVGDQLGFSTGEL